MANRVEYLQKAIKDYTEFLAQAHKPEFYSVVLPVIQRTNEAHIIWLTEYYGKELAQLLTKP